MANPTLLNMPIARDGNKNTIPITDNGTTGLLSQQYGWQLINAIPPQQGGKAVKREDFNGALYLLSNILFYAQKGWQWEFDETQNYFAGCTVKDTADGKTYVCIADVNASTTHPSSDTTHWKLLDLATKDDLAKYLPLAGGQMTGSEIRRNVTTSSLNIAGSTSSGAGAWLELFGKDHSSYPNNFMLQAGSETSARLVGFPDGILTWGGKDLGGSAIVAKSFGLTSSYRKNADGFMIMTGQTDTAGSTTVQFPVSFTEAPIVMATIYDGSSTPMGAKVYNVTAHYFDLTVIADGTTVKSVDWVAIGH